MNVRELIHELTWYDMDLEVKMIDQETGDDMDVCTVAANCGDSVTVYIEAV